MLSPQFLIFTPVFSFHSSPRARATSLPSQEKCSDLALNWAPVSLEYLNSPVSPSASSQRLKVIYWLKRLLRKADVVSVVDEGSAAVELGWRRNGLLFFLPFCILVHCVCFQISSVNLSPSLYGSSLSRLLQPSLSSQTHSFLPIKTVQI